MKCFYCKGTMEEGTTTHVEDFGDCVIVIRNVPCLKCTQCGETSYTGVIIQQIENIIDKVRNSMTEVVIINYNDTAIKMALREHKMCINNMATIRETALNYINELPDDTLMSLIPLLKKLSSDIVYLEKVEFNDLSESEKLSIMQGRKEADNNELIDFNDYMEQRNV